MRPDPGFVSIRMTSCVTPDVSGETPIQKERAQQISASHMTPPSSLIEGPPAARPRLGADRT